MSLIKPCQSLKYLRLESPPGILKISLQPGLIMSKCTKKFPEIMSPHYNLKQKKKMIRKHTTGAANQTVLTEPKENHRPQEEDLDKGLIWPPFKPWISCMV